MRRSALLALCFAAAAFHLYSAGIAPFTALIQRPVHLALMGLIALLIGGLRSGLASGDSSGSSDSERAIGAETDSVEGTPGVGRSRLNTALDLLLGLILVVSALWLITQHTSLVARSGAPLAIDLVLGGLTVLAVLELARRTTGWGIVAVAVMALAYAVAGPQLPRFLAHRGYGATRLIEHLYLSTEGIWGMPLGVSADFVFLFVLFGAVLEASGGGALLIALADRVAGRTRGGPAKTAVVASALMGSLSGSAVANVVTTGSFTIPMMKKTGFKPHFAGAIEAAASTGGQLMPPVMGAGAFILATWTNIPYVRVAAAATIPALLFYVALLAAIHFRAGRMGIGAGDGAGQRLNLRTRVHLLLPLFVVVGFLATGRSPMRAAFWGVVSAFVVAFAAPATRITRERFEHILTATGRGAVQVAAACAAAGVVVGVASLTGIGLRMSELIITLSGGRLPIALILTALGSIVLGMGLPTTAAYVVLAALGAPALVELGVPLLGAHLFIFYFGCLSNVTPPVSLAAFAAAGVAGAPPMKTALTAAGLASAGFLVPFGFIYAPGLLLEGSAGDIVLAVGSALLGVTCLAGAVAGYIRRPLHSIERILLLAAAIALVSPGLLSDSLGVAALLLTARHPRNRLGQGSAAA